jgi:DnaJ domain
MNYYECLGLPRTAGQDEIENAFANWHQKFASDVEAGGDIDARSATLVCNAYRALSQPEHRRNYDEMLVWLESPTIDGAISDEEFVSWLRPNTTIVAEMSARLVAEQRAARGLRRVTSAKLARIISSRRPLVGISCWLFIWVSGAAVFATALRSLYWALAFASKLHH